MGPWWATRSWRTGVAAARQLLPSRRRLNPWWCHQGMALGRGRQRNPQTTRSAPRSTLNLRPTCCRRRKMGPRDPLTSTWLTFRTRLRTLQGLKPPGTSRNPTLASHSTCRVGYSTCLTQHNLPHPRKMWYPILTRVPSHRTILSRQAGAPADVALAVSK